MTITDIILYIILVCKALERDLDYRQHKQVTRWNAQHGNSVHRWVRNTPEAATIRL